MANQSNFDFKYTGVQYLTKKELALELGISASMVSRLSKRGMPTDSVERAKRWRRRHLELGRMKENRFDPNAKVVAPIVRSPAPGGVIEVHRVSGVDPAVHLEAVQRAGLLLDSALFGSDDEGRVMDIDGFRDILRSLPDGLRPRLPMRVWVALVDYMLSEESPVRSDADQMKLLGIDELTTKISPYGNALDPAEWWDIALDWAGFASRLEQLEDDDGEFDGIADRANIDGGSDGQPA